MEQTTEKQGGEGPQPERSVEELIRSALELLGTERDDEAWDVVRTLQRTGTAEVFRAGRQLLASPVARERALGADLLGQLGAPEKAFFEESVGLLLDLLSREQEAAVLYSIGVALGHLHDERAIAPLAALARHGSSQVRIGVVFGLLGHEDEQALAMLAELCADEDREVRSWATFGLSQQVWTDTAPVRDALLSRTGDEDEEIRGEALLGLALRKDERVIEPLLAELARLETAEEWWDHAVEAAAEMADARLIPALLRLRERGELPEEMIEDALTACGHEPSPAPDC